MSRLPVVGGDENTWGGILNDYLSVLLDTDGTLKASAVPGLANKAAKGANSDITSLTGLTTPLSTAQGGTGNAGGTAAVKFDKNGTLVGTRTELNLIEG